MKVPEFPSGSPAIPMLDRFAMAETRFPNEKTSMEIACDLKMELPATAGQWTSKQYSRIVAEFRYRCAEAMLEARARRIT